MTSPPTRGNHRIFEANVKPKIVTKLSQFSLRGFTVIHVIIRTVKRILRRTCDSEFSEDVCEREPFGYTDLTKERINCI